MPEYLAPGVYVEETTFRPRSVEGVPTSTLGMVGVTEWGPVPQPSGRGLGATALWSSTPLIELRTEVIDAGPVAAQCSELTLTLFTTQGALPAFARQGDWISVELVPTPASLG